MTFTSIRRGPLGGVDRRDDDIAHPHRLRPDLSSSEPAAGPANGVVSSVQDVTVGFAQQQLQAPYFAAMQVRAEQIAQEQGFTLLFQSANKDPVIQMNQMQADAFPRYRRTGRQRDERQGQKEMMTQIASKVPVIYIDTSVPGTG